MKDFESFSPSATEEQENEQENIVYSGMLDEKIEGNVESIKRNFDVEISGNDITSAKL